MVALNNIVNKKPELLETIKILDETKNSYTLTQFMDILSKLKIKSAWLLLLLFVRSYTTEKYNDWLEILWRIRRGIL